MTAVSIDGQQSANFQLQAEHLIIPAISRSSVIQINVFIMVKPFDNKNFKEHYLTFRMFAKYLPFSALSVSMKISLSRLSPTGLYLALNLSNRWKVLRSWKNLYKQTTVIYQNWRHQPQTSNMFNASIQSIPRNLWKVVIGSLCLNMYQINRLTTPGHEKLTFCANWQVWDVTILQFFFD